MFHEWEYKFSDFFLLLYSCSAPINRILYSRASFFSHICWWWCIQYPICWMIDAYADSHRNWAQLTPKHQQTQIVTHSAKKIIIINNLYIFVCRPRFTINQHYLYHQYFFRIRNKFGFLRLWLVYTLFVWTEPLLQSTTMANTEKYVCGALLVYFFLFCLHKILFLFVIVI